MERQKGPTLNHILDFILVYIHTLRCIYFNDSQLSTKEMSKQSYFSYKIEGMQIWLPVPIVTSFPVSNCVKIGKGYYDQMIPKY